jgi:hypothetical protein
MCKAAHKIYADTSVTEMLCRDVTEHQEQSEDRAN